MKTLFLCLFFSFQAFAHCPLHYKKENICVMLEQNKLYLYPFGKSHDGPYVDLKDSKIVSVKGENKVLKVEKVARGVYQIEGKELKEVEIGFESGKEKLNLVVRKE